MDSSHRDTKCCAVKDVWSTLGFVNPPFSPSVGLNGMSTNIWEHFPSGQGSPGTPPTLLPSGPCAETSRLKQELEESHRVLKQWGHSWRHTAQVSMPRCHTAGPHPCVSDFRRVLVESSERIYSVFRLFTVVGSAESGCRGVPGPRCTISHGGGESQAGRGGGAKTSFSPAGGAGELKERRQSPPSTTPTPAAPPAAFRVGPQFASAAM